MSSKSSMINIDPENADAFYRYKMPALIAKVEGKGNGIKTVIVNMVEVAKALGRPAMYPCKFFGCELGAQTQFDKTGRYIVNGSHEGDKLQDILFNFIKKFVLCQECDNPETSLKCSKTKVQMTCQACGYLGLLDLKHKFTSYVLKNPPDSFEASSGKKQEKGKKRGKNKSGDKDSPNEDEELPPSDSIQTKAADDEWSVDTSEGAVKARMENLSGNAANLTLSDDLEKTSKERIDIFYKQVEMIKQEKGIPGIAKELLRLKAEAERLDVMDTAPMIMAELLYTKNIHKEIKEYRPVMLHFVVDNVKGQKALLGAFEIIVGKEHRELLPRAGLILKEFYDADLLEEETILEWAGKVTKKHVSKEIAKQIREKVAPFVEWLKNAEEESSGDEDVDVVYENDLPKNHKLKVEDDEEQNGHEDIDIDNI